MYEPAPMTVHNHNHGDTLSIRVLCTCFAWLPDPQEQELLARWLVSAEGFFHL